MRRTLRILIAALVLSNSGAAFGALGYTDGNADGLPDVGNISAALNAEVTFRVYVDTESFSFTNFQAWIERGTAFSFVGATYVISGGGGANFPIDNFTNPTATGFSGFNYTSPAQHGLLQIGTLTVQAISSGVQCVTVISDPLNPYQTFSVLGTPSTYALFTGANAGTCYDVGGGTSTEITSWGAVKGLFR